MNKIEERRRRSDKIAVVLQAVTALCAMIALLISLLAFHAELNRKASKAEVSLIQGQRYNSALDTCQAFQNVVYEAFTPTRHERAARLLANVKLDNCRAYAHRVVHPIKVKENQ